MQFKSLLLFSFLAVAFASPFQSNQDNDNKQGNNKGNDNKQGNDKNQGNNKGNDNKPHTPARPCVKGKAFDRIIQIWLENTDFTPADTDPNLAWFAKQGLTLTNYFGVTHPSEPNYVASVGGDYFGMNNDNLNDLPLNISSIADLLEDKGISWGEYQEDMPSTGYTDYQFLNPTTNAQDYVRKHNPLIIFQSVNTVAERSANIKNFTLFEQDLANNDLPQWVFVTPNMRNDGHDTGITFAGNWTRSWLEPLLSNPHFNSEGTLIVLTFDETGTYPEQNRVVNILLGQALPKNLVGKTDANFYTHYSTIATVEANWGLHTLGRYDVGANVFDFVAEKTGDKVQKVDIAPILLNVSYPGTFHSTLYAKQPIPNTNLVVNGRTVLPSIQKQWASQVKCTTYHGSAVPPSLDNAPVLPKGC
ncbi:hypothetical protein H0H93_001248 [Arthromyces matolae]|nr:hypothetical protein H0H93_001248 [Arthromyces matolae]